MVKRRELQGKTDAFRLMLASAASGVEESRAVLLHGSGAEAPKRVHGMHKETTTATASARRLLLRQLLQKEGALPAVVLRAYLQAMSDSEATIDSKTVSKLVEVMVKANELGRLTWASPLPSPDPTTSEPSKVEPAKMMMG